MYDSFLTQLMIDIHKKKKDRMKQKQKLRKHKVEPVSFISLTQSQHTNATIFVKTIKSMNHTLQENLSGLFLNEKRLQDQKMT